MEIKTVTYYENYRDVVGTMHYNLDYLLEVMKNGNNGLKENILILRHILSSGDLDLYREKKKELLPMFAYSGNLTYRNSDLGSLQEYSNIVIADFDWSNPDEQTIKGYKEALIQNANALHIYAVWLSPGHGIKCAIIHDSDQTKNHYNLVMSIWHDLFMDDPAFDLNCTDISRTCFMSYDPDLWINPNDFAPYHFTPDPATIKPNSTSNNSHRVNGALFQHTEEQIRKNRLFQFTCSDKSLMNMLTKFFNHQNPDYYKDGNRHSEIKKRAVIYCKDGILFEHAVWSLVGQFGSKSRAGLNDNDIESIVSSCYYKASDEFGNERLLYLQKHKS